MPRNPNNPAANDPENRGPDGRFLPAHNLAGPGRPSTYEENPEFFNNLALNLALLGLTDEEMCGPMGISLFQFNDYKRDYPAFAHAIWEGKENADGEVARAMYRRAKGETLVSQELITDPETGEQSLQEVRKAVPADTKAAAIWLGVRQRKRWSQKVEIEHSGGVAVENAGLLKKLTPQERETIRNLLASAAERPDEGE